MIPNTHSSDRSNQDSGPTKEWRAVTRAVSAGRSLRVRLTSIATSKLEEEIRELVVEMGGVIVEVGFQPGRSVNEVACDLVFLPRSVTTAGEILIALSSMGAVEHHTAD